MILSRRTISVEAPHGATDIELEELAESVDDVLGDALHAVAELLRDRFPSLRIEVGE